MASFGDFIRVRSNRERLAWPGGDHELQPRLRPVRLYRISGALLGLALLIASPAARAQSGNTSATQGSIAIRGNVANSTVIVGVPLEKVDELVKERTKPLEALTSSQQDIITLLKEKLDLNERQIRSALNTVGEANVPPERLTAKLLEIAEQYRVLKAISSASPGDDAKVAALKAEAQKAIDAGDLEKADEALAKVGAEQRRALDQSALRLAETSVKRGEIALTRLLYNAAARHFADAAATVAPSSPDKRADYLERQADALYQQGDEFGDDAALRASIAIYQQLIDLVPRARRPADWARMQANLGLALNTAGARESGTTSLRASIDAYRAALTVITRAGAPLDWASISNNLGTALLNLGEKEGSTDVLEEAVATLRQAIEARPRDRVPLDWAATQANVANGLWAIGQRTSGTDELQDAVAAYREALQEATREKAPLIWATIQNNLATTLSELGRREESPARLKEAVAAYNEALKERTRKRYPLAWATVQYNLGSTLSDIASSEAGTASLEQAITAYREALKELTQQSAGMYWARAQTNLGNALLRLGKATNAVSALQEAAAAYREAAKEWTRETSPGDWAMEQDNIGDALFEAAKRESATANLEAAVAAYNASLELRIKLIARDPLTWARTQREWCFALWTLGQRTHNEQKKDIASIECRKGREILAALLGYKDKLPQVYVLRAVSSMGTLSYYLVFMRDYQGALEAADMALAAASSDDDWIKTNKAHALMFLGRNDEARQLYLSRKGTTPDDSWKQPIRTDFAELRSAGLDAPLMKEVEAELSRP